MFIIHLILCLIYYIFKIINSTQITFYVFRTVQSAFKYSINLIRINEERKAIVSTTFAGVTQKKFSSHLQKFFLVFGTLFKKNIFQRTQSLIKVFFT